MNAGQAVRLLSRPSEWIAKVHNEFLVAGSASRVEKDQGRAKGGNTIRKGAMAREGKVSAAKDVVPPARGGLVRPPRIAATALGRIVDRAAERVDSWPIEYQRVVDVEREGRLPAGH